MLRLLSSACLYTEEKRNPGFLLFAHTKTYLVQIIGYELAPNEKPHPYLVISDNDSITTLSLTPGRKLDYTLTSRHCVGRTENKTHHRCSNDTAPYCVAHNDLWECALCTGDCNKPLKSCDEEHAIYIAAFAPNTFKVGVTRSWRIKTRLTEQGADRGAHIKTVSDGRIARRMEADIAEELVDRVQVIHKLETLHKSVDIDAWNDLLSNYTVLEEFTFDYNLNVEQQPIHDTFLSGIVHGTQGRILLLETTGSIYAVDMRDLLGYDITNTTAPQERQVSFSTFN